MGVLILIFKIIGILLAFILLLLLSMLAVPVRYRIDLKSMDDWTVAARFSWLFHFIHFRVMYGGKKTAFRLRIAGIPVRLGRQKAPKAKKAKRQKMKTKNSKIRKIEKDEKHEEEVKIEQKSHSVSQSQEKAEIVRQKSQKQEQENEIQIEKKKRHARRKTCGVRQILQRLEAMRDNLRQRISDVHDKTSTLKEQIADIKKQLSEETNKNAVLHIFRELKWLARHIFPRKVDGSLSFGMADPSQTGQVLGMLSTLPFWARYRVGIEPDFETDVFYLKGQLEIKGHIRACHFLLSALRLLRDKNIKKLMMRFRT